MDYVPFGRTGLSVSVAGLGCGGNSRLGLGRGKSEAEAVRLIRAAHDLGVTLFDTAEAYGTEGVVGEAARQIAAKSPLAVRAAKEAVNRAFETTLREGLLFERRAFHALFATEDQAEGMSAFAEKREAQFRDR